MTIQQTFRRAAVRRSHALAISTWWPLAAAICAATGLVSVLLGPDNNWDLRFYHLYAPWAYLHGRYLVDVGPAQYQGFFNPTADLLFYGLLAALNDYPRCIAFIMGAVHGLNAVLVAALAFEVLRPPQRGQRVALAAIATLIGVTGAGAAPLLGTTTNDLVNSIFVLASLLLLLKATAPARGALLGLAAAGLCAGAAIGLKYTAAIFAPGLIAVAALVAWRRRSVGGFVAFGASAIAAIAAVAGHHMLTLWHDFGNPMFPLFNELFQSPSYDPVAIRDGQFLPRDIWQFVAYPFDWAQTNIHIVSEMMFRDWRAAMAYVAILAALTFAIARAANRIRGRRDAMPNDTRGLALVFVFMIASYLAWAATFGNYRYAVVLEMLTGVAIVGAVVAILSDAQLRFATAAAALTVVAMTTIYPDWGRAAYGARYIDVRVPPIPPGSRVLIASWDPAAYFIPYAEPSARYLGIENNFLALSQDNGLANEVKRLMREPGPAKFVVNVGVFDARALNALLAHFNLKLGAAPCRAIRSNLPSATLALCPAVPR